MGSIIDVELGDNHVSSKDDDDDDEDDDDRDRDTTTSTRTKSLCLDYTNNDNGKQQQQHVFNNGTCVICLEEFVKDDVIVLSHNANCNHIYHKECMVQYLASNAQRKDTDILDITHNPCPTCRRPNFCGPVREEDAFRLWVAVQRKNSSDNTTSPTMALAIAIAGATVVADNTTALFTEAVSSTTTIGNTVASTNTDTDIDTDTDTYTMSDATNNETSYNTALETVTT